jgi:hypothetical protein
MSKLTFGMVVSLIGARVRLERFEARTFEKGVTCMRYAVRRGA